MKKLSILTVLTVVLTGFVFTSCSDKNDKDLQIDTENINNKIGFFHNEALSLYQNSLNTKKTNNITETHEYIIDLPSSKYP